MGQIKHAERLQAAVVWHRAKDHVGLVYDVLL